uniref:Uracil phosphoribosyltransferase n=1 Tax=Sonderella linearis TaxID=110477 RepID=A0A1Z1MMZ2_9FLOR|nr:uracil phosphoribosyltransferase [Sonderella linearis]ARW67134.1 uracil phosphoribosyltransferase [Sonderella linearis]
MKLNIYKISHPIIKLLKNIELNNEQNMSIYENNYKYIGLFLIYEVFRKYIKTKQVYIKNIKKTDKLYLVTPKIKYYILTDLSITYSMILDIQMILPNIKIIHNNHLVKNKINIKDKIHLNKKNDDNIKFFLLEKTINNDKILKSIKYLNEEINISLDHINIITINCNHEIINKIGNIYPTLRIYTTQIIYNYNR